MPNMMVAGNWKMNASTDATSELLQGLLDGQQTLPAGVEMVVFPPLPYLAQAQQMLQAGGIAWGAQNVSEQPKGAFTGEVSTSMLADFGVRYVLVGHSERRAIYAESDATVAAKYMAVQAAGMVPVLCIGETLAQREAGETLAVVNAQVQAVIDAAGVDSLANAVVAYEPVWAIGTGLTATPEQAQEVHAGIRSHVASGNADVAAGLQILYGGSVSPATATELFAQQDIDGGLVGGASLEAQSFLAIGQAAQG